MLLWWLQQLASRRLSSRTKIVARNQLRRTSRPRGQNLSISNHQECCTFDGANGIPALSGNRLLLLLLWSTVEMLTLMLRVCALGMKGIRHNNKQINGNLSRSLLAPRPHSLCGFTSRVYVILSKNYLSRCPIEAVPAMFMSIPCSSSSSSSCSCNARH